MNIGLRGKFLIPAMALIIAGLTLTVVFPLIQSQRMLKHAAREQITQRAAATLDFITVWSENRRQDIFLLAQNNTIIAGLSMHAMMLGEGGCLPCVREINGNLHKYREAHPYYEQFGVALPDGSVLTTTDIRLTEYDEPDFTTRISDREFFQKALQGQRYVSPVEVSRTTGNPVIIISAPVQFADDGINLKTLGIMYASVDLAAFSRQFIEPVAIGGSGYGFVYTQDGIIIAHKDRAMVLTGLQDSVYGRKMLKDRRGIIEYRDAGQRWMVAFDTSTAAGWSIAAVANMNELMAPVYNLALLNVSVTAVILVLALATIILVGIWVSRPLGSINDALHLVAEQFNSASSQISMSSQQLSQGASTQAASIEEMSASLEQLAAMSSHNADNAQQANMLADEARESAAGGTAAMDKLMSGMQAIEHSSSEVTRVARGIEEIAFQTSLLALNAAVEAARAGESGTGFAVVAEEVRNLARRASEQAKTTSALIAQSTQRSREGSRQTAEAGQVLDVILDRAVKVVNLVKDISAASNEQARGIEQINKAIVDIEQIVHQNVANSEQSASASQELAAQAAQMRGMVDRLGSLIEGEQAEQADARSLPASRNGRALCAGTQPARHDLRPHSQRAAELIPFDDDDELKYF